MPSDHLPDHPPDHPTDDPPVTVRPATRADLGPLARLATAHAAHDRALGVPIAPLPADLATRLDRLVHADATLTCLVADTGGPLAGYVTACAVDSTWRGDRYHLLDCLFVAEPFRRRGLALRLFAALVDAARTAGVTRIRWTSPASGPGARGFADAVAARYPRFRVTDKIDCTLPVAA